MTSLEKGPIKDTEYLHNGKGMEYLFHCPPEDSSSEPPLKHLEWSGSPVQTAQRAIIGVPVSYRTYRRDTELTKLSGKGVKVLQNSHN